MAELVSGEVLPRSFYRRDAVELAGDLLGKLLVHRSPEGLCSGRIVELEAYRGPEDRAAHSYGGRRTARNETMWGPAGHAYVYFVYGMHWCMNVVAAVEGVPEAVLIRGLEPVAGLELMRSRRGAKAKDEHLLRGPANACKGMGVNGALDGADLRRGALRLLDGAEMPRSSVRRSPRIGIDYAGTHAKRKWRFYVAGSAAVSGAAALRA